MKFLVEAPVALVPCQLEDICSALGSARAPRACTFEDVWKVFLNVRMTGNLWIRMVVPGAELRECSDGTCHTYATDHVNAICHVEGRYFKLQESSCLEFFKFLLVHILVWDFCVPFFLSFLCLHLRFSLPCSALHYEPQQPIRDEWLSRK